MSNRTCISRSFDVKSGTCVTCTGGGHPAWVSGTGGPVAVAASDHCFPACLPVRRGEGECIRVVRVEDGTPREVTLALADSTASMASGTVICLGSVSHLATVGTSQYAYDWIRSRWWLRERFGEGIVVVPLPPVPVGGLQGRSIVRALVETIHWFNSLPDTECILMKNVHCTYMDTFLRGGNGAGLANERLCVRLPASLNTHAVNTIVSEGWGRRPDGIPPLTQAAEEIIISPLLRALEDTFGLDLCRAPCLERDRETIGRLIEEAGNEANYLVIGGSHASRLAEAMGTSGLSVERITAGGWKISSDNVTALLAKMEQLVILPDVIVIQILDNSAFFCLGEDGSLAHPAVQADKRHHVVGELKVANKDQSKALFKLINPVLKFRPSIRKIVLSCLPRYTMHKCCNNTAHADTTTPQEVSRIMADLNVLKRALRSHIFVEKVQNTVILDPVTVCGNLTKEKFMDPVHLMPEVYAKLADTVTRVARNNLLDICDETAEEEYATKRQREASHSGNAMDSKRGRGGRGRGGAGRGGGRGRAGRYARRSSY